MDIIYDHQGMLLTDADFKGISVGLDQIGMGDKLNCSSFTLFVLIHLFVFFLGQRPETIPYIPGLQ